MTIDDIVYKTKEITNMILLEKGVGPIKVSQDKLLNHNLGDHIKLSFPEESPIKSGNYIIVFRDDDETTFNTKGEALTQRTYSLRYTGSKQSSLKF